MLLSPNDIRQAVEENPKKRPRDLADDLEVPEAALVASYLDAGTTAISAHPDVLFPELFGLGEVMALTRNESAVNEKIGIYDNFTPGDHASMVVNEAVDLRMFPRQWVHGYAVEKEVGGEIRRSVQVFDAAGDAIHKVILRDGSDVDGFEKLKKKLAVDVGFPVFEERVPPEAAKGNPDKADRLRGEWDRLTDTHQFLRLVSKMKMNRLGAYRMAGEPYAVALAPDSLNAALEALAESGVPAMIFVGNRGCIQIHSGPINRLVPMDPWQNIMDPGFNLHLRADHVAELWLVNKPTKRGPAISLEAFAADGTLILQMFGYRKEDKADYTAAFSDMANGLARLKVLSDAS